MIRLSCIIPTYNEATRIGNVLDIVSKHSLIDEILVIDDGSKDTTINIVKTYPRIKLIIHPQNKGKSATIYTGIKESQGEFLLFLDADLIGLTAQNITDIIEPVIQNQADISISLRRNTLWRLIGLDYISGERVVRKKYLYPIIEHISLLPPFGLEVFLNRWIIENAYTIKIVLWKNVDSPFKYKKHGWWLGIVAEISMRLDIYKVITLKEKLYQIYKMLRLKVK